MATYRSWALRVVSPRSASLSSSTRWQNRSSATARNCRKIFQSDSLISRIIGLTVVTLSSRQKKLNTISRHDLAERAYSSIDEIGRQFSPNAGIAESQKRAPSPVIETAVAAKLLFPAFRIPVKLARHLIIEQWRLCFRTLRQPPGDYMEKEKRDANTAARPALWRANVDEGAQLHFGCHFHAGARDRREHGDFHDCQCGVIAPAALSRIGKVDADGASFRRQR